MNIEAYNFLNSFKILINKTKFIRAKLNIFLYPYQIKILTELY